MREKIIQHMLSGFKREIKSESGAFYTDGNGIVLRFEPSENNPFVEEDTEYNDNYTYNTGKSIRTFVVPEGVKGFVSDFMREVRVLERFELPEGLQRIGSISINIEEEEHCVFADCILPTVIIPQSIQEIGNFAFGHTHIESLQLPASLHSPYGRQFKDSYIGTLKLPKEWKSDAWLDHESHLNLSNMLATGAYDYLKWPSTFVRKLVFVEESLLSR